jgi:hypothetical protein
MTDRELLELAAKAAGIVAEWDESHKALMIGVPFRGVASMMNYEPWNPLHDDGDALRLAVKLRMAMDVEEYGLVAFCGQGLAREIAHEPIDGDPYAATRRSIVRAAAAMVTP